MNLRVAVALIFVACGSTPSYRTPVRSPVDEPAAPYTQPGTQQFPAPGPNLEARPWKVGQWAIYTRRYGQRTLIEKLQILAQDACGFWIEDEIHAYGHYWRWQFCVSQQPSADDTRLYESLWAVIERHDLEVVAVMDFHRSSSDRTKFQWLVELVHAGWPGHDELPREDITTPAGQFAQAVKKTTTAAGVETTRWSHPEVPLGGLVRELGSNDHEMLLVKHGTWSGQSSFVRGGFELVALQQYQQQLNRRGRSWFGLGLGYDALGKVDDVTRTAGFEFAAGVRVTPKLEGVSTFDGIGDAPYPADRTLSESMFLMMPGIRWSPFGRPRPPRPHRFASTENMSLWLQADVGYAELLRRAMDEARSTVGRGIAVGARVGLSILQGRDWIYGLELQDHLALFNAGEGLRHSFGARVFFQFFVF